VTERAPRGRRQAAPQSGGRRLPLDPAPALSLGGLVIVAIVSIGLLGGNLPALPGNNGNGGDGGPVRTATPSNEVVVPEGPEVPGTLLYVKDGNLWTQRGNQATQLTDSGKSDTDAMPAWSPDGASIYFVRTSPERGTWPSAGELKTYNLAVPRLMQINADGSGEPDVLLTGRLRNGSNTWSYFIREPAIAPDGRTAAIITDGPNPTLGDPVVKLVTLGSRQLTDPGLPEVQNLGHASPAWSPDGRFLVYVRNAREGARGTPAIIRYNVANEQNRALTTGGYATPAWSRDGRYIAATKTGSFGTNVVILDARNGAELLRLTSDEQSFSPVWSPRMDAIAFFKVQHGVVDLWVVPLEGTAPDWTAGKPFAVTVNAGLDAASRPGWFIPADELPPLPTPTPEPSGGGSEPAGTAAP
jgi:Tol biopolymer transport system component